jgi:hypothetical protein
MAGDFISQAKASRGVVSAVVVRMKKSYLNL